MADTKNAEPTNDEEIVEQVVAEGELVDEQVTQEDIAEAEESNAEEADDDLAAQLEVANARADENWEKLLRMQAEMG